MSSPGEQSGEPPMTGERPRIHWVSPLPPARTDIAEYTRRILPDLAERAEIVLWTDAEAWDPALERHAAVRRFDPRAALPMDLRGLAPKGAGPEAVFLHIGNSWEFHAGILALAARVPGTVVLHDVAVVEFLRDLVANRLMPRARLLAEAERWHGAEGRAAIAAVLDGRVPEPRMLARFPLWEATLGRAVSVLTHTPGAFEAVAARRWLPAWRLELPFAIGPRLPAERAADGPLRLVQFGHIGPNRRLEQVFEALARVAPEARGSHAPEARGGQSPEAHGSHAPEARMGQAPEAAASAWGVHETHMSGASPVHSPRPGVDFVLEVFGRLWDPAHLERRARELGLAGRVRFRGFAPEAELDAEIARAHLVFNLRDPTMGEASGSQLRIWNASAMSVVTDLGWYATLPDDTVAKIPPADEIGALARLIARVDADRTLPARIGAAGRARLEALHGAPLYAGGIARIAAAATRDARDRLMADAARRALAAAPRPDPLAARLAATL